MFGQIWETISQFVGSSGIGQFDPRNAVMIGVGCLFLFLAIRKGFEPLLLIPIGFGIIIGNMPYDASTTPVGASDGPVDPSKIAYYAEAPFTFNGRTYQQWELIENHVAGDYGVAEGKVVMVNTSVQMGFSGAVKEVHRSALGQGREILVGRPVKDEATGVTRLVAEPREHNDYPVIIGEHQQNPWHASPLWTISRGIDWDFFPPLIFLGLGALTDFGPLLAFPRTILLGAAAQFGIFGTVIVAMLMNFTGPEAGAIGIIGGADGPTAIYTCTKLAPHLLGAVALSAYSYMAMVPLIQPPIMKLLTTREERLIRMDVPHDASRFMRILFPIIGFILTATVANAALPLLGLLFFGNLLRESGVVERLNRTAQTTFIDIVTILLGLSVGVKTQASTFLTWQTIGIFILGMISFAVATASGLIMAKIMNKFSKVKVNPLIGSAGVSAVPMAARVSQVVAHQEDPHNFILMHAMGPNVAGVIGTAVAAGVLLSYFK